MEQEPKLRSIPPGGFPRAAGARGRDSTQRMQLALGVALAIALVLLVWSYFSLGSRIDALEHETVELRAAVAERDDVITAQRTRLDEVRGRLQELLALVEQPVPGVNPPEPTAAPAEPPADSTASP